MKAGACASGEPGTDFHGFWYLFNECAIPANAVLIGCSTPTPGKLGIEACCFVDF